jgi:hypothetical protein
VGRHDDRQLAMSFWRALLVTALFAFATGGPARDAEAQSAPTPEEVHQAQARWAEGKAAFDGGNYEAARVAFKQAYTIFQHPAFLQNLGEAELRTGRMVEAARHLTLFLRASNTGSPVQREFARKSLKRAAEKLGSLAVDTNVEEAEIRVDGELIGVSPLAGLAWHVAPGVHLVTGHKEGYLDGTERVQVAAGPPTRVLVRLQRVISVPLEAASERTADLTTIARPAAAAPADVKRDVASSSNSVEPRTVALIAGAVITVVAAGIGVAFTLRTADDTAARNDASDVLVRRGIDPQTGCTAPVPATSLELCHSLGALADRIQFDRQMQFVGFIGAGVVGAATLAASFVWQPSRSHGTLVPTVAPGYAGLRWSTSF